ncbi:hypothetical protein [Klebsiella phage phiKp_32]|nr:hypothetical protein KPN8_285 [Klebsiella phage KPN8]BEH89662.1 hypothetical protein [Klebsiella phage phiKp_32]
MVNRIRSLVRVSVPADIPWASDSRLYHASALFFERWIYYGDFSPEAYDELFIDVESLFEKPPKLDVNEMFDECLLLVENIRNDELNSEVKHLIESSRFKVSVEGTKLINWDHQRFLILVETLT